MFKSIALVATGVIAAAAIPTFATQNTNVDNGFLSANQIEFINLVDQETGTNLKSLTNNPSVIAVVKSSEQVCGNTSLQKDVIRSLGGTTQDEEYASNKFETVFCKG